MSYYADVIDSTTFMQHGVTFRLSISRDFDASPDDDDVERDATDIEHYKSGNWYYVNVDLTVEIDGIDVSEPPFSLGGVEYGYTDEWQVTLDNIAERAISEEWTNEVIGELRPKLEKALTLMAPFAA